MMYFFTPGFGLFALAIIVAWWIAQGTKGVGKKVSRLTAGHSGCSVRLSDDADHFVLCYLGPNNHVEYEWIKCGTVKNNISLLEYENNEFKAVVRRMEIVPERTLKEEVFKARSLKMLVEPIEGRFKDWDTNDGSGYLWE